MAAIEVAGLRKDFPYYEKDIGVKNSVRNLFRRKKLIRQAVKPIDFSIEEGEIVGFLGPNGAGKTTTLKMLSGILYPSGGEARVLGNVPWERKNEFKRQFSIVMGQKNQLWWDLPANESLFLNKCIYEIDDDRYARTLDELSGILGVRDLLKDKVRRLSLGERMKMELIAALLHGPRVLFLDEPTIGLDLVSQRRIREFIAEYNRKKKTTIVLTSHYMADIEDLCDRVIVINSGSVIYDGELSRVNALFSDRKIVTLRFDRQVDDGDIGVPARDIRRSGENAVELSVERKGVRQFLSSAFARLPVADFTIEDIPIEEGIERLYAGEGRHAAAE